MRTYSELIQLPTFEERYRYLKLGGIVGEDTFGHARFLNQIFYQSPEWRSFRRDIIIRDKGCDLAMDGFVINDRIYIHHLNPITLDDIKRRNPIVLDPENAVVVSFGTHQAIHYGDESMLAIGFTERAPNDTIPWR